MQSTDQLFLTALPNGRGQDSSGKLFLRLSLLLTPSLNDNTVLSKPFSSWPDTAKDLEWTVTFLNPDHSIISQAISAPIPAQRDPLSPPDFDGKLWREIFGTDTGVKKRTATNHLHKTWRLSHKITKLHYRHELYQLAHAYRQLFANPESTLVDGITQLQQQTVPPPLFLHPEFQSDPDNKSDLAVKFEDRDAVIRQWLALVSTLPNADLIQKRANYAIQQLEDYGDAKLSAVSLCAAYILSLQSAGPAGTPDPTITAAWQQIMNWPGNGEIIRLTDYPDIESVIHYTQMLLFHRRTVTVVDPGPIKRPDFHQLLGLLHNYPAIMRRLGLVYDLVVSPPVGLPEKCCITINPASGDLGRALAVSPLFTQCTVRANDFFATPEDANLIQNGLLNLQTNSSDGTPRFTLVQENADGQGLKLTDQINNARRGKEYTSSAVTAINPLVPQSPPAASMVMTPQATANPALPPPAPRTVGLALFDQGRLDQLEQSARKVPPTPEGGTPAPPKDFFAEDVILGYRVDVFYNQKFYSICQRKSTYDVYTPRTDTKVDSFCPSTPMELSADEGFVSFGATQSTVDPTAKPGDSSSTQTQIHQSVFTWTGWSLSVLQPDFPAMNQQESDEARKGNNPFDSQHLAIRPQYELLPGTKLPPLRFNGDYKVRCRIVDLAGNGAPPELDPENLKYDNFTACPLTPFSRHEPIRAPQFLLLEPINRTGEPGTHIDHMVARDNDKSSSRMLIPPRESLRLAELSGILKSDKLPDAAFGHQQLLVDGSFPSVACAKHEDWIEGTINPDDPGDNDPIFLRNIEHNTVKNPYYPDPLANYVRIDIFELTDDPAQSVPFEPRWLSISKDQEWPDRLPVRVRLNPKSAHSDLKISVDDEGPVRENIGLIFAPTLEVELPEARTVVLRISSAAVKGTSKGSNSSQTAAVSKEVDFADRRVHLFHLAQFHRQHPEVLGQLVGGLAGTTAQSLGESIISNIRGNPFASPDIFVDGNLDLVTPQRTMTLVHAVKRPLEPPDFAPAGSDGSLQVTRDPSKAEANVTGQLLAHWLSTGKITCYAEWCDRVDDLTKPGPIDVHHREVAFVVTAGDFKPEPPNPPMRLRTLKDHLLERFLDTRAHDVTYKLVASTNFREYYPGAGDAKTSDSPDYQREGKNQVDRTVLSSVRPLAPSVLYIIPAFIWDDTYDKKTKTWYSGRTVVLRAYMERPFLLSGNRETIGVVLFHPSSGVDPANQNLVSRWGADPARPITTPILHNELSEVNLCEAGSDIVECTLAEGDLARIKPCTIHYSDERQLWYSDIPINTQHANAPFVRLALVRWQPDALAGPGEARSSQVVFAEFMQISPDRWVSIQKHNGSNYIITISGAFANDSSASPFQLKLQKRWYALGKDTGWREIKPKKPISFHFTAPDPNGVSTWTTELQTPHSAYVAKYRVFLSEQEFPGQESRKSFSTLIDLP
ncbi:MAG TPA: hypothetical protein VKY85_22325 [Candidatus Angelobacter sp.]|nr:hypothetical protein [Candidatus Angelobacter sp.]